MENQAHDGLRSVKPARPPSRLSVILCVNGWISCLLSIALDVLCVACVLSCVCSALNHQSLPSCSYPVSSHVVCSVYVFMEVTKS